jgi:hypothetical protein
MTSLPPPPRGHFVLHTNVLPSVTAGAYELLSTQTGTPFGVAPESTHVTVAAPRFAMPTDQILSTYPPANAEGAFGDRLPQIVLKRRTLPWERNPSGGVAVSPTPWVALVVVAEGEGAELSAPTAVAQCVTPGVTLPDPTDRDVEQGVYLALTETVVHKVFPCAPDLPLLCHVRHVDVTDTELAGGDDDGWLAVVLANRLPVYDAASDKPVRYLACLVSLEGQLGELPPPLPPASEFTFELAQDWTALTEVVAGPDPVVMGNVDLSGISLPVAGGLHAPGDAAGDAPAAAAAAGGTVARAERQQVIPLDGSGSMAQVSVTQQWATATGATASSATGGKAAKATKGAKDADAAFVARDTMSQGFRFPISVIAQERVLRFPVLAHWSFTTAGAETFETLMQDLDVGLLGTVPEPAPEAPPAPGPPPEVVQTGHLGLGHRTRRGDPLRAWYRGPLVPFPTERDAPVGGRLPVAHSADQLKRVVPGGREDLGLAAAYEIGRLLGLSQLSVVSALTRFRAAQFGAGRVRTMLGRIVAGVVGGELPELTDRLDPFGLGRFVALAVLGEVAAATPATLGPRRPLADPGGELKVDADIDELVATGLGLDLAAVRKRADAVGIVAALTQTAVPVAFPAGGGELDQAAVAALQAGLAAEVDHVVSVAVPPGRAPGAAPPRGARTGRRGRAGPPADALDELIDTLEED